MIVSGLITRAVRFTVSESILRPQPANNAWAHSFSGNRWCYHMILQSRHMTWKSSNSQQNKVTSRSSLQTWKPKTADETYRLSPKYVLNFRWLFTGPFSQKNVISTLVKISVVIYDKGWRGTKLKEICSLNETVLTEKMNLLFMYSIHCNMAHRCLSSMLFEMTSCSAYAQAR
jgi:hypothetical protein